MNYLYLILLLLLFCSCEQNKVDFAFDSKNIPEQISDKVSTLNLKNPNERLLAVAYERTLNIPSFDISDEELLLLTDNRFLRYFTFENGEEVIQEFTFNNCLDLKIDSLRAMDNYIKYDVNARLINKLFYNEKEERLNLIPDFKSVHFGGSDEYISEFDSLNSLILKTWRNQVHYDSLQTIENTFYDETGNWIITQDRVIEKEKMQSLKNKLSDYDIYDSYDFLVVRQDTIMRISYYYYDKQFTVTSIKADPIPTGELEMSMLIDYYLSMKDTIELPYELKNEYVNTTYITAQTSNEQDENELIKSYFK